MLLSFLCHQKEYDYELGMFWLIFSHVAPQISGAYIISVIKFV